MTRRSLNRKESKIHDLLVQMSSATHGAIKDSLLCFKSQDQSLARRVIADDNVINSLQHQVEDECVSAIALYQPVASDLRDLISDTFIAIELERIADHAADIARIVTEMVEQPREHFIDSIERLGQKCQSMLERVMEAYDNCDGQLARQIAAEDDEVDVSEQNISEEVLGYMREIADETTSCSQILWVVHNLERIGDRVTNIAERVVFMATGEIVDLNQ
ncbi:phosphate signaling complex protein PhoU [Kaarinaea lacus]